VFFTRAVASALFLQGSLMFQKPTVADLRQAAHKLGMNPSDAYLDAVEQIITPLANAYALLDTAPDELPAVKYPRRQRPSAEENPHGAYMKTWIKGKPGDVQNSPVKIPSFCGLTLTRISHTTRYIGAPNQRKLLCRNDFPRFEERPDADRV
jgi:hypothetical protein